MKPSVRIRRKADKRVYKWYKSRPIGLGGKVDEKEYLIEAILEYLDEEATKPKEYVPPTRYK
jgi:hypothetical protein